MKLPCYLVRDLLPLYKDEVCDPQTAADLKEHLAGCESCRAALAALAAEPAARAVEAEKQQADAVALRLLRRRLVVRWIAIALATAVLTLAGPAGRFGISRLMPSRRSCCGRTVRCTPGSKAAWPTRR